jgi:hypothetical protein
MRLQGGDQVFNRASGMSDGVENGQYMLDAEALGSDSLERCRNHRILIRKHRPQIEQHSSLFDTADDGRIGHAQAGGHFVGA